MPRGLKYRVGLQLPIPVGRDKEAGGLQDRAKRPSSMQVRLWVILESIVYYGSQDIIRKEESIAIPAQELRIYQPFKRILGVKPRDVGVSLRQVVHHREGRLETAAEAKDRELLQDPSIGIFDLNVCGRTLGAPVV
jgi:hypothetical protein